MKAEMAAILADDIFRTQTILYATRCTSPGLLDGGGAKMCWRGRPSIGVEVAERNSAYAVSLFPIQALRHGSPQRGFATMRM